MSNVLVRDDSASCRRTMTDEEKAPYREKQRSIAQQLRNKRQVLDTPERTATMGSNRAWPEQRSRGTRAAA